MTNKAVFATAVVGALFAAAVPASAGVADRFGGAADLCAAPWQWNGPLSLLHEGHAPGYTACDDSPAPRGDSGIGDACSLPWRWNGPLEIVTVQHSPSSAACEGDLVG